MIGALAKITVCTNKHLFAKKISKFLRSTAEILRIFVAIWPNAKCLMQDGSAFVRLDSKAMENPAKV